MSVRSLLLENFSWKLLSLTLALLIYFGARLFMHQDVRTLGNPLAPHTFRDFHKVPIRFLSRGELRHPVKVEPDSVMIRVSGELPILDRLTAQDAVVYVEVPGDLAAGAWTNRVEVKLPPSLRVLTVVPERVVVVPDQRG